MIIGADTSIFLFVISHDFRSMPKKNAHLQIANHKSPIANRPAHYPFLFTTICCPIANTVDTPQ